MQEPTLVEPPSLSFHGCQEVDLMILVGSFRIFHDSLISAAMLRMCYVPFYLSLTYFKGFIILLSVFWALGKPVILDRRRRPLSAQSHRNLQTDQEQHSPHCWHHCVVRKAEGGTFICLDSRFPFPGSHPWAGGFSRQVYLPSMLLEYFDFLSCVEWFWLVIFVLISFFRILLLIHRNRKQNRGIIEATEFWSCI